MIESIILVIFVVVALGFCLRPVIKETIIKNTLKKTELFEAIEDAMSYEEVCEVLDEEAISHKELKVGIKRRQMQYIWNFEEVDGKMYNLICTFEKDILIAKDIVIYD